jgi:hypothetical protein
MIRSTDYGESKRKTSESVKTRRQVCAKDVVCASIGGPEYATPRGRVVDFWQSQGRAGIQVLACGCT